jgi:hypothetical protein
MMACFDLWVILLQQPNLVTALVAKHGRFVVGWV